MLVTVPYVIVQVPPGIFDHDGQTHFFYEGETVPTALEPYIVPSASIVNPPLLSLPSGTALPTTLAQNGGVIWFVKLPEDQLYRWSAEQGAFVGIGGGSTEYGTYPDLSTLQTDRPSPNVGDTAFLLDADGATGGSVPGMEGTVYWDGIEWILIALVPTVEVLNTIAYSDSVINVPKIDTLKVPNEGRFVAPVLPIITGDDTYDAESDYITDAVEGMMVLHYNIIDNLYLLAVYSGGQWRSAAPFYV